MAKGIAIPAMVFLCLMFIMGVGLYAETSTNPAPAMQEHIEKVKLSNPEEYEARIERAEGNITDCCSCHKGLCKEDSS